VGNNHGSVALSAAQPPASFSSPLCPSRLFSIEDEEDTPRLTVKVLINRACGSDRCPPRLQADAGPLWVCEDVLDALVPIRTGAGPLHDDPQARGLPEV
jgi:hypothetical protein